MKNIYVCRKLDMHSSEELFLYTCPGLQICGINKPIRSRRILNRDKLHGLKYLSKRIMILAYLPAYEDIPMEDIYFALEQICHAPVVPPPGTSLILRGQHLENCPLLCQRVSYAYPLSYMRNSIYFQIEVLLLSEVQVENMLYRSYSESWS